MMHAKIEVAMTQTYLVADTDVRTGLNATHITISS